MLKVLKSKSCVAMVCTKHVTGGHNKPTQKLFGDQPLIVLNGNRTYDILRTGRWQEITLITTPHERQMFYQKAKSITYCE